MNIIETKKGLAWTVAVFLALIGATGCGETSSKPAPTTAEVKTADTKRQSYIDSIPNLTPEQRAQMKSHMGGPPAAAMPGQPGTAKPAGGRT